MVDSRMYDRVRDADPMLSVKSQRNKMPAWAVVTVILGLVALLFGSAIAVMLIEESGPAPVVNPPAAQVITSGICEKKLVGEYGLIATVHALNTSGKDQTGALWVRWPVTGEAAQEFSKPFTLAPGQNEELTINQSVPAERWYRTGACSFGWTPA